jgi:flagellin-like hook-associated protein FlgL
VFSGFRTDQPPFITQNNLTTTVPPNNVSYTITIPIDNRDVERRDATYWRDSSGLGHMVSSVTNAMNNPNMSWLSPTPPSTTSEHNVNIIQLPYAQTTNPPRTVVQPNIMDSNGNIAISVVTHSLNGAANPYTQAFPGIAIFIPETGELVFHDADIDNLSGLSIVTSINGVFAGEPNPRVYFQTIDTTTWPQTFYNQNDQNIQFEVGTNVRMTINTQARDVAPWKMFADLKNFINFVNNIDVESWDNQIEAEQFFREALYQKFTDMMSQLEGHNQTFATEFTALGSRMNRIDLITNRLDENEDTFTALMSDNENLDIIEVAMRLSAAESLFQASLQVGARIAQISLVNYI